MRTSTLGRTIEAALLARDFRALARATDEHARDEARRMLIARLGGMRGLPQKLGQSLSLSADPQFEAFASLAEQGEPLPFAYVTRLLEERWGCPMDRALAWIDPEGLAASIGQVHRARLHDGREVAVKLAYPGIREAVIADLRVLGLLGEGARLISGIGLESLNQTLRTDLDEELDYRIEAEQQRRYAEWVHPEDAIVVPAVVSEWSNDQVLVTSWCEGLTLEQAANWPEPLRQQLGDLLARHFLRMLFNHGWVHADPHRGNYRFRLGPRGPEVVLYDFGAVAKYPKRLHLGLLRLILATRGEQGDPFPLMVDLGFREDLLAPLRDRLPALCKLMFEPFLQPSPFDPAEWRRSERTDDLLGEGRWNFRASGPAELVFLVRAFQGLFHHLAHLGVKVSFWRILNQAMADCLAETLALPMPRLPAGPGFATLAKALRLRLVEGGEPKVSLEFPAQAVERLAELVSPDLRTQLEAKGIDVVHITRQARRQGYAPGELFTYEEGSRQFRAWLE